MLGRTLGGATVALLQGLLVLVLCFAVGFRPASFTVVPEAILYMALIAIVFCALGTAIGSRLENMQAFPMVSSFVMMPMYFLSGALYRLQGCRPHEGGDRRQSAHLRRRRSVRGALIGVWHFGAGIDLMGAGRGGRAVRDARGLVVLAHPAVRGRAL